MIHDWSRAQEQQARESLLAGAQRLHASGLNSGTAGNLSLRLPGGLLITPSSLPYDQMGPEDLVAIDHDGRLLAGTRAPSSEWRLHADLLSRRPDIQAVVHCHSAHATALACHGRGIPAFHYMVVQAGGPSIRCAGYATFGSQARSDLAVEALEGRLACLLAHHGQVAIGSSLEQALALAGEVENLARIYGLALALGEPPLLSDAEMDRVAAQMEQRHYGALSAGAGQAASLSSGAAPGSQSQGRPG